MKSKILRILLFICIIITLIIPLIQLSIGFHYVVNDGQSPNNECSVAPDLPLLLAIGGIFALFFLGTAYGFLNMLSSINNQQSDIAGRVPRILVGLVSFILGSISFIFFILIQKRVYEAYSNNIQYNSELIPNYCRSIVMRGALALIILTYITLLLFIAIFIFVLINAHHKRREKLHQEFQMKITIETTRF